MTNFMSFFTKNSQHCKELADKVEAVNRTQAVIEFDPSGTILSANDNFLQVMGYGLNEVIGRHHRMFVDPSYGNSPEYQAFWDDLRRGEFKASEYKRLGKDGKDVWIFGSYNPLKDASGNVYKVVKFASDMTERKLEEERNRKIANLASALKLCQASVMLADNDFNIVYMNDKVQSMLKKRERILQSELNGFAVEKLMGTCVDDFHQNPSLQRKRINSLTESYETELKIADLIFRLIASPWLDSDGNRLGTVVEWEDLTEERARQAEAERIADENARVRQALDQVTANVMIADQDANIIYLNKSVLEMMQRAEKDIRKDLPNFDSGKLQGVNIDVLLQVADAVH